MKNRPHARWASKLGCHTLTSKTSARESIPVAARARIAATSAGEKLPAVKYLITVQKEIL